MTTKRLPDSLKEASEFILSNITDDTYIPLFTKSGSTEVMRKIKANVLNNGGGGGSAESLIPKRVIYINPDKEIVAGECYPNFAAARSYIESLNTSAKEKYCIELPAGSFTEPITLDEKWLIHGNNTTLDTRVYSNVVIGQDLIMNPGGVFISDCTISGGFAGYHVETEEDMIYLPVYKLNHCRITEFCCESETLDQFFCLCDQCEIETTRSHNDLVAKGIPIAYPFAVYTLHSTILQFGAAAASAIYCFNTDIRNVGAYAAIFVNCGLTNKLEEEVPEINVVDLCIRNSSFQILGSNNVNMEDFTILDSDIVIRMNGSVSINDFTARNSNVHLRTDETATITINESWVSPDTVCRLSSGVTWSARSDHTMCYIMYSTDGGATMSYDSTGATHYGILKNLPDEGDYRTDYYMWFPMNI